MNGTYAEDYCINSCLFGDRRLRGVWFYHVDRTLFSARAASMIPGALLTGLAGMVSFISTSLLAMRQIGIIVRLSSGSLSRTFLLRPQFLAATSKTSTAHIGTRTPLLLTIIPNSAPRREVGKLSCWASHNKLFVKAPTHPVVCQNTHTIKDQQQQP